MKLSQFIEDAKIALDVYGDLEIFHYCKKDETWYSPDIKAIYNTSYIKGKVGINQEELPSEFLSIEE